MLDVPFRVQRITCPVLVWLASGFGRPAAVRYAMVGVHLVAIGGLAGRLAGWPAGQVLRAARAVGLGLGLCFGFVWTLSRDLTELVDAAALVMGVLGVRERRWGLAAAGFAATVLSRETSLAVVAAYGLWQLPGCGGPAGSAGPTSPGRCPLVLFVLWQAYGRWRLGAGYLNASVLLLATLGASLSAAVWVGPADLRVLGSLYVLCLLGVVRSRRPTARWVLAALVLVTAVQVAASALPSGGHYLNSSRRRRCGVAASAVMLALVRDN